jgi:hypothetical protein
MFSNHPAYPDAKLLRCERDAVDRDRADLAALRELRAITTDAIARAGRIDAIRHPDRRWTSEDLVDALTEQLTNIDATVAMIRRSPLVVEG